MKKLLLILVLSLGSFVGSGFAYQDGEIDTGFTPPSEIDTAVKALAIQSDGKIIAGGWFLDSIVRLNINGTKDTSFNIGSAFSPSYVVVNAIKIQSDGKIIVGGEFTSYSGVTANRIIRLHTDGTRDTGFNIGSAFNNWVSALAVQSDGKIIAGGSFTSYNGTTTTRVIRLNGDGTIDPGFYTGVTFGAFIEAIAIQDDGKIIVGRNSEFKRLNSGGTIDTNFKVGNAFNSYVKAITIQDDGKIIVGGGFTTYSGVETKYITRLNTDGTKDTGFNVGTSFNGIVFSLAIQNDGKIIVGGFFTSYSGVSANYIVRLNPDGTRDTGFNIGTAFDETPYAIAIQSDGKIVLGGEFYEYSGAIAPYIMRLHNTPLVSSLLSYLNGSYQRENITFQDYNYGLARKSFVNPGDIHNFIFNFINNAGRSLAANERFETPFHFKAPVTTAVGSGGTGSLIYKVKFFHE